MGLKESRSLVSLNEFQTGEPLSLVGIGLDDETWRFLGVLAEGSSLFKTRSLVANYRSPQQQDLIVDSLGQPAPDICLIDFDLDRQNATLLAERIHASLPGTAVFAVSSQTQPSAILEAMRCGCSEYLSKPIDREQLVNALVRIGARSREKKEQGRGQVLAFMGAKGGCGTTTIATQFAALLASSFSRSALFVDLHPDFGDAALYLKLNRARYHSFELLENADRLDADFLQSFLMKHSSGLELIPAPEGSSSTREDIPAQALSRTLDFLRLRYEFIVIDLPPALSEENLAVIRECDQLYLVTVAEVSAVRNVVRQLEFLGSKDIPRKKLQVVLNRDSKRKIITDAQIEKVIEQKIFWRVPNHYPQVLKAIHEGDPVGQLSSSEVTRSLEEWAESVGRKSGTEPKKKEGGGLLGLFR